MSLNPEFTTALRAVHGAGKILRQGFRAAKEYRFKGAIDLVTEWDLKSQAYVTEKIRRRFPDHDMLSEEGAAGGRTSPSCWILDPIDGTTNFVHGFPFYAVSLALLREKELQLGIVHNPELEETYWAVRGAGAFLNGERLQVSGVDRVARSLLATGFPYNIRQTHGPVVRRFERLITRSQGVRRPGSAALDLCYVARGVYDGFWEQYLKPWDTAAGMLIVQEAGGMVTDFAGKPFPLFKKEIAASNGLLHRELLELLRL